MRNSYGLESLLTSSLRMGYWVHGILTEVYQLRGQAIIQQHSQSANWGLTTEDRRLQVPQHSLVKSKQNSH